MTFHPLQNDWRRAPALFAPLDTTNPHVHVTTATSTGW